MPRFGPINRRDLIAYFRQLGFEGPYAGAKDQIMHKGDVTIRVPNPHAGDIGRSLLASLLRQAGIDRDEWEKL